MHAIDYIARIFLPKNFQRCPSKRRKSFFLSTSISIPMPRIISGGSVPKPLERVMIFIDGGYIRQLFKDLFEDDQINFTKVKNDLLKWYNSIPANPFRANLIRVYYYDGIADGKDEEYLQQREYFDELEKRNFFLDVVLGEAVKLSDGTFRQKGVDILMAIDAVSMAYQDHYDTGLFLLADRDFIPLIEAVKGAGKKTFGFFYVENVSEELRLTFDFRLALRRGDLQRWHVEKPGKAQAGKQARKQSS